MSETREVLEDDKLVIPIPDSFVAWFICQHTERGVDMILGVEEPKISYEQAVAQRELFIEDFGIGEYENLLRRILWQSKTKMSFADFEEFPIIRNNFRCYFGESGNWFFDLYKKRGYYQDFAKKYPEMNEQIMQIYTGKMMALHTETHSDIILLYKAYELMFDDPRVITNHNLFS